MKEGSTIVCINNNSVKNYLTVGQEYVIDEYYEEGSSFVSIKTDTGKSYYLSKSRFKLKDIKVIKEEW